MDDFVAPNDPLDRTRVRELSGRSDAKGLARLAAHMAILAATGMPHIIRTTTMPTKSVKAQYHSMPSVPNPKFDPLPSSRP